MMKKYVNLLVLSMSCIFLAHGEGNNTVDNISIIPPSPEVSSLMKYLDFPVSPFTGQPNINIPIYTIKQGSIEVPISLNYHGGGIKVYELPGYIGMGWSLVAGGCISRTVHGLPDELNKEPLHGLFHLTANEKAMRTLTNSTKPGASTLTFRGCGRVNMCWPPK